MSDRLNGAKSVDPFISNTTYGSDYLKAAVKAITRGADKIAPYDRSRLIKVHNLSEATGDAACFLAMIRAEEMAEEGHLPDYSMPPIVGEIAYDPTKPTQALAAGSNMSGDFWLAYTRLGNLGLPGTTSGRTLRALSAIDQQNAANDLTTNPFDELTPDQFNA